MTMLTDVRPAPGAHVRRRGPSAWRHLDPVLIVAVLLVSAFGVVMVWSTTRIPLLRGGQPGISIAKKQAEYIVVGLGVMLAVAAVDYRRYRDWAWLLYAGTLLLLVAVFAVGKQVSGAQAWFQVGPYQFEPAELAKVALVVALAAYAAHFRGRMSARGVAVVLALTVVPFALVYKEPALGSALVLLAIAAVVVVVGGARGRVLGVLALAAVIGVAGAVELGVLKGYQQLRITSFLRTPNHVSAQLLRNPAGAPIYNVVESKNAIAHGGPLGQGIGHGSATNLSQVPAQYSDFIFSAAGEQVGLVGCAVLLALFLVVIWRTWQAAVLSRDTFGRLVCAGVLGYFAFEIFENVGMTMGLMPVAGIPLPWMSYGGSAILVEFACVGLVLNVRMRRFS
ncbi:MAG: FtsW/RodA/SpoVE family cell cycle protein [Acidimicrobiales bacterium]